MRRTSVGNKDSTAVAATASVTGPRQTLRERVSRAIIRGRCANQFRWLLHHWVFGWNGVSARVDFGRLPEAKNDGQRASHTLERALATLSGDHDPATHALVQRIRALFAELSQILRSE